MLKYDLDIDDQRILSKVGEDVTRKGYFSNSMPKPARQKHHILCCKNND
ncbi:hypothetical protein [uncultured Methanobrevibacter sp.]|nr:hypothetical protein [uncultured Methanobrevibacter sp.]